MRNLIAAIVLLLTSSLARADWQGKMHVLSKGDGRDQVFDGAGQFKGKNVRLDIEKPTRLVVLVDINSRKGALLFPQGHFYFDKTISESDLKGVPICDNEDAEACLLKYGFHKTHKKEKINGYATTLYEADLKPPHVNDAAHSKAWLVDNLPGKLMTRMISVPTAKNKPTVQIDVTDIKVGPIPEINFAIPKDYQTMPNAEALFKGFKGN